MDDFDQQITAEEVYLEDDQDWQRQDCPCCFQAECLCYMTVTERFPVVLTVDDEDCPF